MGLQPLINAKSFGEGIPVIFIHGWLVDGTYEIGDFEPIFEQTTGYRRIYPDLPGHGKTSAKGVADLDSIYKLLVDFINETVGDSNFLLVGTSCGGYLARALAEHFATRIEGLMLRVPMIYTEYDKRDVPPFQPLIRDDEIMNNLSEKDRRFLQIVLIQRPEFMDTLRSRIIKQVAPGMRIADYSVIEPMRQNIERYRLSHFTEETPNTVVCPALIVAARQDEEVGWRDSLKLAHAYPRSTYVIVDRAGHAMPVEGEGMFQSLVRDWLYRVDEWRTTQKLANGVSSK